MKQKTKKEGLSLLHLLRRSMPMFWRACPWLVAVLLVLDLLHAAGWAASIWVNANLFDTVAGAVQSKNLGGVLLAVGLVGAVTVYCQLVNGIVNFLADQMEEKEKGAFNRKLIEKAARADPIAFETPALLDDINKAREGASAVCGLCIIALMILTFYVPYFIFVGGYLFTLKPLLILAILCAFMPCALSQFLRARIYADYEDSAAPLRRQMEYYESAVGSRETFKETRLLGACPFFLCRFAEAVKGFNRATWKAERKSCDWELISSSLSLLGYGAVLWMLVDALLKREISIGSFAAVFGALGAIFGIMQEVVQRHLGQATRTLGTVRNFMQFMDLPERSGSGEEADAAQGGVTAEHVTFSYPGAEKPSLSDISLHIEPGETVAVVGPNGAGKTTLVKLLTGLYVPQQGCVTIGGKNTVQTAPQALFARISGVFQQYAHYKMTLQQNISISQPENGTGGTAQDPGALEHGQP